MSERERCRECCVAVEAGADDGCSSETGGRRLDIMDSGACVKVRAEWVVIVTRCVD